MASIDWHDFVVVETIEFDDAEDEELPQPMTLKHIIAMVPLPPSNRSVGLFTGRAVCPPDSRRCFI